MGWLWIFIFGGAHLFSVLSLSIFFLLTLPEFLCFRVFPFLQSLDSKCKMGYSFLLKNQSLRTTGIRKNISPLSNFLNFQGILKPLLITAAHPSNHGPQTLPTRVNNLECIFFQLFCVLTLTYFTYISLFVHIESEQSRGSHYVGAHNILLFPFFAQRYDLELINSGCVRRTSSSLFQLLSSPPSWALRLWSVFAITNNTVKTLPVHFPWATFRSASVKFLIGEWGTICQRSQRFSLMFCSFLKQPLFLF